MKNLRSEENTETYEIDKLFDIFIYDFQVSRSKYCPKRSYIEDQNNDSLLNIAEQISRTIIVNESDLNEDFVSDLQNKIYLFLVKYKDKNKWAMYYFTQFMEKVWNKCRWLIDE